MEAVAIECQSLQTAAARMIEGIGRRERMCSVKWVLSELKLVKDDEDCSNCFMFLGIFGEMGVLKLGIWGNDLVILKKKMGEC